MLEQLKTDRVTQAMLVGVVLVGCFACTMMGLVGYRLATQIGGPPAQQAQQAPVPVPATQAPAPTPPPAPTATQAPTPEPTPTTGIAPEVRTYGLQIAEKMRRMVDAIDALDPFLTSIRPDDNQWRQDLATKIADVRAVHQELKDMKEPAEMIHIHSLLLAATGDCDQSMENLTKGLITGLDVEAMKKANELMRTCGEKMREPRRMLEEYLAAHDSRK